ncbi:myomegalin [Brachionus plicatilis]|uniref:Myomegalin n=1 Tax=Brachionus plicatilis TaxID=10195 RepID=A0A3M7PPA1_BRAPC|nr:myomegalin [Brachionus plicatilis]
MRFQPFKHIILFKILNTNSLFFSNQQLEEKIESLEKELEHKENQIEEIKKKNENLAEQFELLKLSFERELCEKASHKLEKELNGKLDEVYQDFYLKEKAYQNEINSLKNLVYQRNKDIDILKQYNNDSLIKYKNTTVQQIDNLIEELKDKENIIKFYSSTELKPYYINLKLKNSTYSSCDKQINHKTQLVAQINKASESKWFYSCIINFHLRVRYLCKRATYLRTFIKKAYSPNISANGTNENLHDEIVQNRRDFDRHIKSIKQDLVESLKTHYQFIVSDLENQLQLKENLLQKYILIVKDKDYQLNQLINVNLLCHKEKSQQKLELFINDLRKNLNDKDDLYEQFVKNHFDLLKQKDDLIINLRSTQKQLHSDLNRANEILLESETSVEILKNELQIIQLRNNNLTKSLELENKKTKELVTDHQLEMEEKEQIIQNLQNNQNSLKERLKKKNEKCQLTYFYEQQLEEKDSMIALCPYN